MPFIAEDHGVYKLVKNWCCQSFHLHLSCLSISESRQIFKTSDAGEGFRIVSARELRQLNPQCVTIHSQLMSRLMQVQGCLDMCWK